MQEGRCIPGFPGAMPTIPKDFAGRTICIHKKWSSNGLLIAHRGLGGSYTRACRRLSWRHTHRGRADPGFFLRSLKKPKHSLLQQATNIAALMAMNWPSASHSCTPTTWFPLRGWARLPPHPIHCHLHREAQRKNTNPIGITKARCFGQLCFHLK